jgi:hypothetical protein
MASIPDREHNRVEGLLAAVGEDDVFAVQALDTRP